MAATASLTVQPYDLSPINRELWYVAKSTLSNVLQDFKFLFRVKYRQEVFNTADTLLSTTYLVPRLPNNNICQWSPHQLLKSFISTKPTNFNPFQVRWNTNSVALNSPGNPEFLLRYNIDLGLQYNPMLEWEDTINVGGLLGLTFSEEHDLVVGDIITLNKNNKTVNFNYDGTASVTDINNDFNITTDITWGNTQSNPEDGFIINAIRWTSEGDYKYTWNAVREYNERTFDFTDLYMMATSSNGEARFLTNNGFVRNVYLDDYETVSMIMDPDMNLSNTRMRVTIYNGDSVLDTGNFILGNNYRYVSFGSGPRNILEIDDTLLNNATHYIIEVTYNNQPISQSIRYNLKEYCSSYEKVRVVYLNRLGGMDYFNFTKDKMETSTIERVEWKQIIDREYEMGDRGLKTLASKVNETFLINSDWISEKQSIILEEMVFSPELWILDEGNEELIPINITDNNYIYQTAMREQMISLQMNYKYSYNKNTQNS